MKYGQLTYTTKIRSPASAETDFFYCLEALGSPWPVAVVFPVLPGSKDISFCAEETSLFHFTTFSKYNIFLTIFVIVCVSTQN